MDFNEKRAETEMKYVHDLTLNRIRTAHSMWIVSLGSIAAANAWSIKESQYVVMFLSLLISVPFILSLTYQLGSIIYCRSYIVARYYREEPCFDDVLFLSRLPSGSSHLRNSTDLNSKFRVSTIFIFSLPYWLYIFIDVMVWSFHIFENGFTLFSFVELISLIFSVGILLIVLHYLRDKYSAERFDDALKFWMRHIDAKEDKNFGLNI